MSQSLYERPPFYTRTVVSDVVPMEYDSRNQQCDQTKCRCVNSRLNRHTHTLNLTPSPPPSPSRRASLSRNRNRLTPHLFRYTSASTAWEAPLEADGGPYLLVAPPHGVLPVGNIITMLSFPMVWGHSFKGLTTDAALRQENKNMKAFGGRRESAMMSASVLFMPYLSLRLETK